MAALSADTTYTFDPRWNIGLIQQPATADTYYRGGLAHLLNDGTTITLVPVDADFYMGVVSEHKVTSASDLVWIASAGRWFFAAVAFAIADLNKAFAMPNGTLFDNPADLHVAAGTDAGAVGYLYQVGTTAVDGWLNTDHRMAPTNS